MSDYARILPAISYYERLARAEHGAAFVAIVGRHFADMQAKYYSAIENPDYSTNTQKFCYLYKYAVSHGYYIYSTLRRLRPKIKPSIFSRNPTRIACIGGGPATEIIGLAKYLREVESENVGNPIEITVFDREPSWNDACQRILACVGSGLNITLRSLGDQRTFLFRHKFRKDLDLVSVPLPSGSVLLMKGLTQRNYQHAINREKRPCGPRINLTFRMIYTPRELDELRDREHARRRLD